MEIKIEDDIIYFDDTDISYDRIVDGNIISNFHELIGRGFTIVLELRPFNDENIETIRFENHRELLKWYLDFKRQLAKRDVLDIIKELTENN